MWPASEPDDAFDPARVAYEMELAEHRSTAERAHRAELATRDITIDYQQARIEELEAEVARLRTALQGSHRPWAQRDETARPRRGGGAVGDIAAGEPSPNKSARTRLLRGVGQPRRRGARLSTAQGQRPAQRTKWGGNLRVLSFCTFPATRKEAFRQWPIEEELFLAHAWC